MRKILRFSTIPSIILRNVAHFEILCPKESCEPTACLSWAPRNQLLPSIRLHASRGGCHVEQALRHQISTLRKDRRPIGNEKETTSQPVQFPPRPQQERLPENGEICDLCNPRSKTTSCLRDAGKMGSGKWGQCAKIDKMSVTFAHSKPP
jgi:hypothetical protein